MHGRERHNLIVGRNTGMRLMHRLRFIRSFHGGGIVISADESNDGHFISGDTLLHSLFPLVLALWYFGIGPDLC